MLAGVYGRDPEHVDAFCAPFGVAPFRSLEQMLEETQPDFVVVSLSHDSSWQYNRQLLELGVPVLAETPPAPDEERMNALWKTAQACRGKIQVAEQYFLKPLPVALGAARAGGLPGGGPSRDAILLPRVPRHQPPQDVPRYGLPECAHHRPPVRVPRGAHGRPRRRHPGGRARRSPKHNLALFEFEGGKVGLFDFSSEQYHSLIRGRRLHIQGEKGEIIDDTVRYLAAPGVPAAETLRRVDVGAGGETAHYHLRSMMLGSRELYASPYRHASLSNEEIAIARCMEGMGEYVRGGESRSIRLRTRSRTRT